MQPTQIAIFKKKEIRKTLHEGEWWFSVIDVIAAVTESDRPRKYWSDLKKKLLSEGYSQLSEKIGQLKLLASDGKYYETDCGDTETIFRIIQSIPSPKAEPFKRWLAKVGYERVQEIENPELATKRTRTLYKLKGYPDEWIEKRMRGIAIREELTDEWKKRGADYSDDYEILTAENIEGDVWGDADGIQEVEGFGAGESPGPYGRLRTHLHDARRTVDDGDSSGRGFEGRTETEKRCESGRGDRRWGEEAARETAWTIGSDAEEFQECRQ